MSAPKTQEVNAGSLLFEILSDLGDVEEGRIPVSLNLSTHIVRTGQAAPNHLLKFMCLQGNYEKQRAGLEDELVFLVEESVHSETATVAILNLMHGIWDEIDPESTLRDMYKLLERQGITARQLAHFESLRQSYEKLMRKSTVVWLMSKDAIQEIWPGVSEDLSIVFLPDGTLGWECPADQSAEEGSEIWVQ